jgi:hypothetical protein
MTDMKREKDADGMTQSAVRLPRELHERLKRAGGERGMGEEIRRRLEASFEAERVPRNPKTRELLDAICFAAEELGYFYADSDWSEVPFAFEVLKGCIDLLLAERRPKGEAVVPPTELFQGFSTPKDVSQMILYGWKAKKRAADEEKRR